MERHLPPVTVTPLTSLQAELSIHGDIPSVIAHRASGITLEPTRQSLRSIAMAMLDLSETPDGDFVGDRLADLGGQIVAILESIKDRPQRHSKESAQKIPEDCD